MFESVADSQPLDVGINLQPNARGGRRPAATTQQGADTVRTQQPAPLRDVAAQRANFPVSLSDDELSPAPVHLPRN